jgi:hypothetical protein
MRKLNPYSADAQANDTLRGTNRMDDWISQSPAVTEPSASSPWKTAEAETFGPLDRLAAMQ